MQGRRSLKYDLEPINSEIERTFHHRKQVATKDKIEENIVEAKIAEETQERPFKDYFSPLASLSTTCI